MKTSAVMGAVLGLGLGLVFYLAHRSDDTVSNRLLSAFLGRPNYLQLKQELRLLSPLPAWLRGCLPSALWCFIVTSACGGWRVALRNGWIVRLAWLCPVVNALWETVQWLGWTDGRADGMDVLAGFSGGGFAQLVVARGAKSVDIGRRWDWRLGVTVTCLACMGLADVWR